MPSLRFASTVVVAIALAACSAIINPDSDRLGTGPDAGPGRVDSGPGPIDSGPPPRDGGGPCVEGSVECNGEALVSCFGGREVVEDCQARSAFCEEDHCEDWACTPGHRECTPDRRFEIVCTARGDQIVRNECIDGVCSTVTNACVAAMPPPVCPDTRRIIVGESVETDLCGLPDARTFERTAPGCDTSMRAASGDEIFLLELDRPTLLTFELTDVDTARAVDTVLYIRSNCEDLTSQIACADDVPCLTSTVPGGPSCVGSGSVDVRQSRVTLTLPAGRYYIVADAFARRGDGTNYTCGRVRLSVHAG